MVDPNDFRQALSRFAAGVTVITTGTEAGEWAGFTATAFSSVSLEPPLVLFCVSAGGRSDQALRRSDGFGVNVLRNDMAAVAERFATPGADRFAGINVREGPLGVPLLNGAIATLTCRRHARHDAGDHGIFIGHVVEASWSQGAPLLHFRGAFGELAEERIPGRALHDWMVGAAW
jgi:flavin reductase (DIM6/NTAB) family NADH-FMN oxidoreductase RutF